MRRDIKIEIDAYYILKMHKKLGIKPQRTLDIAEDYILDEMSLEDISKKYNIKIQTIKVHLKNFKDGQLIIDLILSRRYHAKRNLSDIITLGRETLNLL